MAKQERMPVPGDLIAGKYQVEKMLGRGGMGAVFAARHADTGRFFAVKWMEPTLAEEDTARARFIREAKLAGSIDHPAVVNIYDVGEHDGSLYMVMDLLKGESLAERLKRGPIPFAEAAHIMIGAAQGVAAAHKKGVVHRDLKPDNIFLCRSGPDDGDVQPVILDFGVCKAVEACSMGMPALTRTGITVGTPLYMSPEQLEGSKGLDQRSDIYALGIILYKMVSGEVPYNAENFASLVVKIVAGDAVHLSKVVEGLPRSFGDVVMRAFALNREDRYPDAESFAAALAPFAKARKPAAAVSDRPPVAKGPRAKTAETLTPFAKEVYAPRRLTVSRVPVAIGVGAGALLIVIAAFFVSRSSPETAPKEMRQVLQPAARPAAQKNLEPAPIALRSDGGVAAREQKDASLPMGIEAPRTGLPRAEPAAARPEPPVAGPAAVPAAKPSRAHPSSYKMDEEQLIDPFNK